MVDSTEPNNLDNVLFGGTANPYLRTGSYSRVAMASVQAPQTTTLLFPRPMQVSTGVTGDLAKCVWDKRVPVNCEVLAILNKYTPNASTGNIRNSITYVVYQQITDDHTSGHIGLIEIPTYHTKHAQFGFKYILTQAFHDLEVGQFLKEGTVLATSPGVTPEGNYAMGHEANFCFLSDLITHEDGCGMNAGVRAAFATRIYNHTSAMISKDTLLLNMFGTDDNYVPFSGIGEQVRGDGLLLATRKLRKEYLPLMFSRHAVRNECPVYDDAKYVPVGSVVEDITIIRNPFNKKTLLPAQLQQFLDRYADNHESFYRQIRELDAKYRRTLRERYIAAPEWHKLVVHAEKFNVETIAPKGGSAKPIPHFGRKGPAIEEYYIMITTSTVILPTVGFKFTDNIGHKFVVCGFSSWEESPTDRWGRKAWFWANPSSVSNRNNGGQLIEMQVKDACFQTLEKLKEMRRDGKTQEELWDYLVGLYRLVSQDTLKLVEQHITTPEQKQLWLDDVMGPAHLGEQALAGGEENDNWLKDALAPRIGLLVEPDSSDSAVQSCRNLRGTPYEPARYPIKLTVNGRHVETKLPVQISNKYIIMLEKIGSYPAAVTTPRRTLIGVAAKLSTDEKKSAQISEQALRFGESEFRGSFASCGPDTTAYFAALSNSASQHKHALRGIFSSNTPSNIDNAFVYADNGDILPPDRPQGSKIFDHNIRCLGTELTND